MDKEIVLCEEIRNIEYIPDMDYNGILVDKKDLKTSDDVITFFKGFGVIVSVYDDLEYWNCTFENCDLSVVSHGNGLLDDGSVAPSITLTFCDTPNKYWRGY